MRIGIGAGPDIRKVLSSAAGAGPGISVVCFTSMEHAGGIQQAGLMVSDHPGEAMVRALMDGEIDAAVRGSLPSSTTLRALKDATGVDHLLRIAILSTPAGKKFLLAPVGVDEGWTVADKLELVERGRELAARLGLSREVAVLSGGRLGDVGRHPTVDRTLADAELVARLSGAAHREILIEDAIGTSGMILARTGSRGTSSSAPSSSSEGGGPTGPLW